MSIGLDQIVAAARLRIAQAREANLRRWEQQAQNHVPRGFRAGLKAAAESRTAVIAELKKASPSRGLIRKNFDPRTLAQQLEGAGAAALSVLTDEKFFQGSLTNLRVASETTQLPCLRKDFILDEVQLLEARANCADAVLLIVAALLQQDLIHLVKMGRDFGLDVLCEAHDEDELKRALDADCDLVGVNNRDLRTFAVNIETAFRLAPLIPKNVVSVAESGIQTGLDIARLRAAGYHAFLIGESLMKHENPGHALTNLLRESAGEIQRNADEPRRTTAL